MTIAVSALLALHTGVLALVLVNAVHLRRGRGRWDRAAAPRVSVLVPARNEEANLQRLLPSLQTQALPGAQFVVVDDRSEDGTWAVLQAHADPRLLAVRGSGPPAGWVGKPHALFEAAQHATGDLLVFLDADAELRDPDALRRLAGRWAARGGPGTALTGLPRYLDRGPAALLTSLVPFAVLAALPIPLVPRTASASLSALNGQIWAIGADDYRRLAPHEAVRAEVLEDVQIGRYLKRRGLQLHFADLAPDVAVRMYGSLGEAWRGFRKNAYLLAGGRPLRFALFFSAYAGIWVLPSALWMGGALGLLPLASLVLIKACIDRLGRFSLLVSLAAPLTLALGAALQLDSALAHAQRRVMWKGRDVAGP